MLTGEDVLNFFPAGRGMLPISGPYLVAIQALPMGGRRAEGKLLFSHSDDRDLMIQLAAKCVDDNRRLLNLARANGLPAISGPDLSLIREQGAKDQKTKFEVSRCKGTDLACSCGLGGDFVGQKFRVARPWLCDCVRHVEFGSGQAAGDRATGNTPDSFSSGEVLPLGRSASDCDDLESAG
jgi:hypothetical protein